MFLARTILTRTCVAFGVLFAISIFLFVAIETLPGDLASETAARFTPPEEIELARDRMGLNEHPARRYFDWLGAGARGDFGTSTYSRGEIAPMLADRLGNTALLAAFAFLMVVPTGFAAAVTAVILNGSALDRGMTAVSLMVISMPEFLIGYLLMTLFVVMFPVFPAHTIFYEDMGAIERLHAMVLPAATLAAVGFGPVLRISRASLLNVLASGYIETAKLKGLPPWRVVLVHALPNALPPIINMIVLLVANFLVGAFIVEQIFSYPGIGNAMIAAVKFRDIPLVLAIGLVFAVFFVLLNLLADIVSILSTPRLRTPLSR